MSPTEVLEQLFDPVGACLTPEVASRLVNETKRPITKLLRDAVDALWAAHLQGLKNPDENNGQAGG